MRHLILSTLTVIIMGLAGTEVAAEPLEIGLALTPTVMQDESFEAFSSDYLRAARVGIDIRAEVADPGGFKIIPFVGYRIASSDGQPYDILKTELLTHDFMIGLRIRKGILPWMSAFAEVSGGLLLGVMSTSPGESGGEMNFGGPVDRTDYTDNQSTWSVGGIAGLEFHLAKTWLRSRGIKRFTFGGELAGGYVRRGDLEFDPELEKGEDNSLAMNTMGSWGEVNLSGWMIQIGLSFKFF
jgi:hypothetical protein